MKRTLRLALTLLVACGILSAACNTGGAPSASPEFTTLVTSTAQTGGRFGESSLALAASYQAYLDAKTPQNMADIEALIATLATLQKDMGAYAKDVEAAVKLMRQLAAEQDKAAHTLPSLTPVAYAQGAGADDASDLAIQQQKGIIEAGRVQACYDEIKRLGGINYLTTNAGAKKKDECDAMDAALHKELARRGVGTVVGALGGTFAGAAAGAAVVASGAFTAGIAPIAAGAIVITGVGYIGSAAVGMLWDYCTTSDEPETKPAGGQKQQLPKQCGIASGRGKPGSRIPIPVVGKGTLALYADGQAPLIIRNVSVQAGQDTTVDGTPVPLNRANPKDMARATTAVKQGTKPPGSTTPTAAPAPTPPPAASGGKECWTRSPVDSAHVEAASGVFTFKFSDATFEMKDSGAAFKGAKASRPAATSSSDGSYAFPLPDRICAGDEVSFALKQGGKFNLYPYPSLGEADRYASAQALVDGVLKGDRFAASGSTSETVGPYTSNSWKITPPAARRPFKVGLLLSGAGGTYTAAALWTYEPQ